MKPTPGLANFPSATKRSFGLRVLGKDMAEGMAEGMAEVLQGRLLASPPPALLGISRTGSG